MEEYIHAIYKYVSLERAPMEARDLKKRDLVILGWVDFALDGNRKGLIPLL